MRIIFREPPKLSPWDKCPVLVTVSCSLVTSQRVQTRFRLWAEVVLRPCKPHVPEHEVLMFTVGLCYSKTQLMSYCNSFFSRGSLKQKHAAQSTILSSISAPLLPWRQRHSSLAGREWGWLLLLTVYRALVMGLVGSPVLMFFIINADWCLYNSARILPLTLVGIYGGQEVAPGPPLGWRSAGAVRSGRDDDGNDFNIDK